MSDVQALYFDIHAAARPKPEWRRALRTLRRLLDNPDGVPSLGVVSHRGLPIGLALTPRQRQAGRLTVGGTRGGAISNCVGVCERR